MTTPPDMSEVNARLEQLLADLRATPAPPPPEPDPFWQAPDMTDEAHIEDFRVAALADHGATAEELEACRAQVREQRGRELERQAISEARAAEERKTNPHYPRFAGAPGTEPAPAPVKRKPAR